MMEGTSMKQEPFSSCGDVSGAKRTRYDSSSTKQEVELEEDYELELHHGGDTDEFGVGVGGGGGVAVPIPPTRSYEWEESDEEDENIDRDVKSRARDPDGKLKGGRCFARPADVNSDRKTDEESRNHLKRSYEGGQQAVNFDRETDPGVISRRSKQIEYGKNTPEYFNYLQAVPKDQRQPCHPRTPNKLRKYSRRAWDGIVKQWRINLHCWSEYPIPAAEQLAASESDLEKLNESFTSEASGTGSTSTTSSVAAAFSAELGFLNKCNSSRSASASESENEFNTSGPLNDVLNSTVVEKKPTRLDEIKIELNDEKNSSLLSKSWAEEVEEEEEYTTLNGISK